MAGKKARGIGIGKVEKTMKGKTRNSED